IYHYENEKLLIHLSSHSLYITIDVRNDMIHFVWYVNSLPLSVLSCFEKETKCDYCFAYGGDKICSKCRTTRYCSIVCQRLDWVRHKHACGSDKKLVVDVLKFSDGSEIEIPKVTQTFEFMLRKPVMVPRKGKVI